MYELIDGCLKINNKSFRDLTERIHKGEKPKDALINELKVYDIDIKDVYSIELSGSQMANKQYVDTYSAIITDVWNKGVV